MEEWKQSPKSKAEGKRNERRLYLCWNVCLKHCLSSCVCMCTYLIQHFCQKCVAVLLPFPFWSRVVQEGWLVGWLHRKGNSLYQRADGGQHVLTLQKQTRMQSYTHMEFCANTVNFIKCVTQIANRKCQLRRIWSFHRVLVEWGDRGHFWNIFIIAKTFLFLAGRLFCSLNFLLTFPPPLIVVIPYLELQELIYLHICIHLWKNRPRPKTICINVFVFQFHWNITRVWFT